MKSYLSIGLIFGLALLAACTSTTKVPEPVEGPSPELCAIDSLMWRQPDSAFAVLQQFAASPMADSLDVFNGHYCQLLISELLYKNDWGQSNRPALQQAVAYFDSLTLNLNDTPPSKRLIASPSFREGGTLSPTRNDIIILLDARAHYINGVGYYENDSVVPACKEYMKALEVMENLIKKKDLKGYEAQFMALTYTRLSILFSDLYLHEQAIYFAQLSLASNQKLDVPKWHIARMLCEIGAQYDIMKQLDSAEYYYNYAVNVLNDTNSLLYRDISSLLLFLSYKNKGLQENTLTQIQLLLNKAKTETEYLSRCLTIGEVYFHEKQFDSARYYIKNVYNETKSLASKKQAAEWLLDISKTQEKYDEILEYADFLAPFANQEENQSEVKSQLTELYNAFRQLNLSRQHQKMVKKNMTISLVVIGALIVGLLSYVFLYHYNKRRKQLLEKQIKEEQLSHDMKQKALSGRLKQSNQKLQETLKSVEKMEAELKTASTSYDDFNERYNAFRQSTICLEILNAVNNLHDNIRDTLKTNADVTEYKAFALTLSQTAQLIKTVESFFPNLYPALKTQYATLDRKEWLHCCLYILQLDKMSICVLLQEPYYTCRRCVLKLEDAFDCRQGLSTFILEQARIC